MKFPWTKSVLAPTPDVQLQQIQAAFQVLLERIVRPDSTASPEWQAVIKRLEALEAQIGNLTAAQNRVGPDLKNLNEIVSHLCQSVVMR